MKSAKRISMFFAFSLVAAWEATAVADTFLPGTILNADGTLATLPPGTMADISEPFVAFQGHLEQPFFFLSHIISGLPAGFQVAEGDVVLLESGGNNSSQSTWSDVVEFRNKDQTGAANPTAFYNSDPGENGFPANYSFQVPLMGTPQFLPEVFGPGEDENDTTFTPYAATNITYRLFSDPTSTPEPSSVILLAPGCIGLFVAARLRRFAARLRSTASPHS
jgi:hypothetical protein